MTTIVLRSPLARAVAIVLSLSVSAVIYFAVVKPQFDAANEQARQTIQQVDEITRTTLDRAQRRADAPVVPADADEELDCVAQAGTDVEALQACAD